jgi:hypothetical protein
MKSRGIWAILALAVMGLGVEARADNVSVTATFDSNNQYSTVPTYLTSNYNENADHVNPTTVGTAAGIYWFTETGISSSSGTNLTSNEAADVTAALGSGSFVAVCMDLTHNVYYGQSGIQFTVKRLSDLAGATGVNGVGINQAQANAIGYIWKNEAATNTVEAAALQMAIWDIVYNGGATSLSSVQGATVNYMYGGAYASGDAQAAAVLGATWAQAAAAHSSDNTNSLNVYALVSTGPVQSFNFALLNGTGHDTAAPVPLPAAAGVGFSMLGGFGGLFAFRKRLNRRARIA